MYLKKMIKRVFVVAACRTPIGRVAGQLSSVDDTELMALTFKGVLGRLNNKNIFLDGAYVGCCFPQEYYNLARKAIFAAQLSDEIPAVTLNRTCCSSMEALIQGARQIMTGDAEMILVGGVENMSKSPHVMRNAIRNIRAKRDTGLPLYEEMNGNLIDETGICAEITARKYGIKREEQDDAAYESRKRACTAWKNKHFQKEILPVQLGEKFLLERDEYMQKDYSRSDISGEKPIIFEDGTITKMNASPMSDGAAAMILASETAVEKYGLQPLGEYVSSETIAVPFIDFLISPAIAIEKLLKKNNLSLEKVDLLECNEAFSVQHIICGNILGWDADKVNISGGSVAVGHPLGCTGLRICTTLIHSMIREKGKLGIAAMCAGGGMGQSILFRTVC